MGDLAIIPESFKLISETSLDIIQTFDDYNTEITANGYKFFFDIDLVTILNTRFIVPTTQGNKNFELGQYTGCLYWSIDLTSSFSLAIFAAGNGIALANNIWTDSHNDVFSYDYGIYCLIIKESEYNFALDCGFIKRWLPIITSDVNNNEYFSYTFDNEINRFVTSEEEQTEAFANLFLFGFTSKIVYDTEDSVFKAFEFRYEFSVADLLRLFIPGLDINVRDFLGLLVPGFNYFDFMNIKQLGYRHYAISPLDFIKFSYELYFNLDKQNLDYIVADISLYLFGDKGQQYKNELSNENKTRHFGIALNGGLSYSKDIFPEGVFGYSVKIALKNIPLLISTAEIDVGYSNNYHATLYRLPIKDGNVLLLELKLY